MSKQPKVDLHYLYLYGDQHHATSERAKQGEKFIADGGSNIHTHFLLAMLQRHRIHIDTYQDNYQVANFFGEHPNVSVQEYRTLSGLFQSYLLKIETLTRCFYPALHFLFSAPKADTLVTQTDFLPDTFAAWILKKRFPHLTWCASYFLRAPAPWEKDSPYKGSRWLIGLAYWMLQAPSLWFIKNGADKVWVTSEPDVEPMLSSKRSREDVMVVQGGVDITQSEKYLASDEVIPLAERRWDACFLGRFHYQKGVTVLIKIWAEMVKLKPDAKLVMIGEGPLEPDVRELIAQHGLEDSVDLVGIKGGEDKFEIFKQSKVMVHPATYDSGGMAAAEGMAWGLPAVSFDLEALQTYYPQGMLKTPPGDYPAFAANIKALLDNGQLYQETAKEALELIRTVWSWEIRAQKMEDHLLPKKV